MNNVNIFSSIKYLFIALGLLIGLIYGSIYIGTQISMDTADRRGEADKMEQVEADGAYRVAEHDRFYKMCSDIQTKQQNIKTLKAAGEKDAALATEVQLNNLVNQYNSMASNNYTAGQFKADELPYHIKADEEVKSCGAP